MPPLCFRNSAHQKTLKHRSMVEESKAYTLPLNGYLEIILIITLTSILDEQISKFFKRFCNFDSCLLFPDSCD